MMFLLDTNLISELRRPDKAAPQVIAWARSVEASLLYISRITLMELEQGVALQVRRDPAQGAVLRAWLEDQVWPTFKSSVLSFDAVAATICGRLQVPGPWPFRACMVAATALAYRATL